MRGNPDGIVKLYEELGAYSDIERLSIEIGFFEVGTGYFEENSFYGIPQDPNLWRELQWDVENEEVSKVMRDSSLLRNLPLLKQVKLESGVVYNDGKREFKEILHCFGFANAEALAKRIMDYDYQFNTEGLQRTNIEVTVRTRLTGAATALRTLMETIAEVEKETFQELNKLTGMAESYNTKWTDQVNKLSPAAKKIAVIRYQHTYRVIKQIHYDKVTEEIAIKGKTVMEQDEEGKYVKVLKRYSLHRNVIIKLKQEKNIYEEEEEELKEEINKLRENVEELKKITEETADEEEADEEEKNKRLSKRLSKIKGYEDRIKRYEERLENIKFDNIMNKGEIINKTTPKIPRNEFWQRPEEYGYGLDENGHPLEIDPDTGEILIDRWWNEISQNSWQLETIAKKPGGLDYLKRHLDGFVATITGPKDEPKVTIINKGSRRIRHIRDERFHGYVDLLELGTSIYSDWDSFRDDLRDGRYHRHSKSVADYVIEGEGGFDDNLCAPYPKVLVQPPGEVGRSKGMHIRRRGVIPTKPIGINIDVHNRNVLINATPKLFENVRAEEMAVKQNYKMKLPDGSFKNGIRSPTKYNPAFDRRAFNLDYVYWGTMYYYRWAGYVNEWDENPFPHISSRGLALYIDHLVKSDVWTYKDAEEVLEGHKFDYGVRGMGEYGEVNPASGKGILQEN
ncbi:hypothetical protein J4206_02985 [Candidatus Woesearchaeota archaeon]|nr:hypothetical protein [Candidatus Woesearchaeota archaeon]